MNQELLALINEQSEDGYELNAHAIDEKRVWLDRKNKVKLLRCGGGNRVIKKEIEENE